MRKCLYLTIMGLFLTTVAFAQSAERPDFGRYHVSVEQPRAKSINFKRNAGARSFRTRLSAAWKGGVNFAGHYIIAGWGCGTGCTNAAVIDTRTGSVTWPYQLANVDATYGSEYSEVQLDFRKDSRLLIIHGRPGTISDDGPQPVSGDHYYVWGNTGFHHLISVPKRTNP